MTTTTFDCSPTDKTVWIYAAKQQQQTLNEFIVATLNAQVKNMTLAAPAWMPFSVRVCDCLVRGGITNQTQLIELIDSGDDWHWQAMPNFSTRCYNEVLQWRNNL